MNHLVQMWSSLLVHYTKQILLHYALLPQTGMLNLPLCQSR
uniref:Uncharacterized protein n=1 Tax=Arundo donax TaxID=35708 RepID=A0A0A9FRF2_ARUDO